MSSSNGDTLNFNVNFKVKGKKEKAKRKERGKEEKEGGEERQGRKQTVLKKIKNTLISYYLSMVLSAEGKSTRPVWW